MTKEAVVVLCHIPWDYYSDYVKQTTLELAKKAEVVVFNPLHFLTLKNLLINEGKRRGWLSLFEGKIVTYFPSLAIFPFQRFKFIEKLNIWLGLILFRLFYLLRFGLKKPIFWVFSYDLEKNINCFRWGKLLVYDRLDQAASLDPKGDWKAKQKDRRLLRTADFVFVNSPYSLKYVKRYNKRSFLLPEGCAKNLFFKRKGKLLTEIKKIKRPRLGLVGHIDLRLDFKLLYDLATKKKNWNFVLIGPVFDFDPKQSTRVGFYQWLAKIKKLANVYFLGERPKEQLADFIAGFNVCLIPYDISQEFVKGCNPMKLYEYLAMGKPVVSTPIEAVKVYSPIVKIANNATSFEKAIEAFLGKGDNKKEKEKRKKIAEENSWENKARAMWRIILTTKGI